MSMEELLNNYLGIGIMVLGGLVALIGVLLLVNHGNGVKVIIGIVLAAAGLGGVGIGYTIDQGVENTYTVVGTMQLSDRGDGNDQYRITLKSENGTETWIYVNDNQKAAFASGAQVTMSKRQLNMYRDQESK